MFSHSLKVSRKLKENELKVRLGKAGFIREYYCVKSLKALKIRKKEPNALVEIKISGKS